MENRGFPDGWMLTWKMMKSLTMSRGRKVQRWSDLKVFHLNKNGVLVDENNHQGYIKINDLWRMI